MAKVWLDLKSHALQDLVAWQDAVIQQDMLPSAADIRGACKVRHLQSETRVITVLHAWHCGCLAGKCSTVLGVGYANGPGLKPKLRVPACPATC